MYPSSSSSSSQGSMGPSGLIRYGSAPGSFLTNAVDSVIGGSTRDFSTLGSQQPHLVATNYFSAGAGDTSSITSELNCKANPPTPPPPPPNLDPKDTNKLLPLHRSYGFGDFATANVNLNSKNGGGGSLVRHSSSPAGFLNHLTVNASDTAPAPDNGFSVTRGIGSYNSKGVSDSSHGISRLASQLSFTRQDSLSHISEESENIADGISTDNGNRKAAHSYATSSFGMGSWDESNAFVFSDSRIKRAKCISSDTHCLNTVESQLQFSLPQTVLEMETMENILQMSQDSIPCKIRAKRGCATHPRSIAERDRRTRINGKLKKLQELVPNLDKQTSYADMLDLAVQHIKGLQNQVQKLNKELENCSCGCKQAV